MQQQLLLLLNFPLYQQLLLPLAALRVAMPPVNGRYVSTNAC